MMATFRCVNPRCGALPRGYEFEADRALCPKCGWANLPGAAVLRVFELTPVHFTVQHPDGPIWGFHGPVYVACQPKRDALARHPHDEFAASPDPRAVTCPSCKATKEYCELAALFPELKHEAALKKAAAMLDAGAK